MGCQNRVVADVVDLIVAVDAMAQDHVGGGARGRRRVGSESCKEAVAAAGGVEIIPGDLARVVDSPHISVSRQGIVDGGEQATAVKKAMGVSTHVEVSP